MELTKEQDLAALRKLGIRVEVIETPVNFEEICAQTLHISKLIGGLEKANAIVEKAKQDALEIKKLSKDLPHQNILFQIGANPIFSVLENTFMNDFITFSNGTNIAAGLNKGTLTRESVLAKNPDVIIIATMGGFGSEEQKVWQKFKGMNAVKNEKVFLISSETSCSPTPANFVSALKDVYSFVK